MIKYCLLPLSFQTIKKKESYKTLKKKIHWEHVSKDLHSPFLCSKFKLSSFICSLTWDIPIIMQISNKAIGNFQIYYNFLAQANLARPQLSPYQLDYLLIGPRIPWEKATELGHGSALGSFSQLNFTNKQRIL